jgi:hypothetical protein
MATDLQPVKRAGIDTDAMLRVHRKRCELLKKLRSHMELAAYAERTDRPFIERAEHRNAIHVLQQIGVENLEVRLEVPDA